MGRSVCIAAALIVLWAMAVAQPLLARKEDELLIRQKRQQGQQDQQDQQGQGLGFGGLGQGGGFLDAISGFGTRIQQAASDFPGRVQDAASSAANAYRDLLGNAGQTLSQGASSAYNRLRDTFTPSSGSSSSDSSASSTSDSSSLFTK